MFVGSVAGSTSWTHRKILGAFRPPRKMAGAPFDFNSRDSMPRMKKGTSYLANLYASRLDKWVAQ